MAKKEQSDSSSKDPLLDCLLILTEIYQRPVKATSLKAGMPLIKGKVTPEIFKRMSESINIDAEIISKDLKHVTKDIAPCVLLLKGNKACVLKEIDKKSVTVIFPQEIGRPVHKLPLQELENMYAGKLILTSPQLDEALISQDSPSPPPSNWFWGTLFQFWPIYSQVALASVFINLFTLASTIFVLIVYDRVIPNQATDTLWVLAIGVAVIFIFDFILKLLRSYFLDTAGKSADVLLASRLYEHLLGLRLEGRPRSAGVLAHQLREFETLRDFISSASLSALVDLPFVFLFIFVIWLIGGPVAYVPLIMVPLVLIVSYFLQKPLSAAVQKNYKESGQKHALLIQSIQGLETIKGLGVEGKMQGNWEKFVMQAAVSTYMTRFFSTLSVHLSSFAQNLTVVGIIIVGVYQIGEQNLTMGGLIACSILSGRAMGPLVQVVSLLTRLDQSMESLKRLNQLLKLPVERPSASHFVHRAHFKGAIQFVNVDFAYPGQKELALSKMSFKINPGEKVGILGRIGSGKTTIEKLILGFYPPHAGAVLIDGTDINQLDPADLRANIGYIPQDVFLFGGTIRHNIILGGEAVEDDDLLRVSTLAGVNDFVARHPLGFDIPVGEGGVELSGGQRQTIAIARAFVRDPSLFLFDEPTAQMDNISEHQFLQRLKEVLDEKKTLVLITHRPSLLSLVDRLIVVDRGRLVADGPKDKVLQAFQSVAPKAKG